MPKVKNTYRDFLVAKYGEVAADERLKIEALRELERDEAAKIPFVENVSNVEDASNKTHISKFKLQEDAIILIVKGLNFDPLALPKNKAGKKGVKAEVRAIALSNRKLFGSDGVFDKAWARLFKYGEMVIKE